MLQCHIAIKKQSLFSYTLSDLICIYGYKSLEITNAF